ncbi:hypothetical protein L2E82_11169 [Cichorium intybus]|uniref:Uncharacterized protein n=1 Tax=Cichorium intybus TaxID=13427 RepID=A0ACB9GDL5_CICIN|nr:hypothetical protein L2E82_11169 [Cichorium intybus]
MAAPKLCLSVYTGASAKLAEHVPAVASKSVLPLSPGAVDEGPKLGPRALPGSESPGPTKRRQGPVGNSSRRIEPHTAESRLTSAETEGMGDPPCMLSAQKNLNKNICKISPSSRTDTRDAAQELGASRRKPDTKKSQDLCFHLFNLIQRYYKVP